MPKSVLLRRTLVSLGAIGVLLLASTSAMKGLASMREPPAKAPEVDLRIAVRVEVAQRKDFVEQLTGYGRARALHRTTVAAEVPGLVVRLAPELEAGGSVPSGPPLVWLDDRDAKNRLESIGHRLDRNAAEKQRLAADRASLTRQLEIAREELAIAERELARVDKLLEREVATQSARDAEQLKVTLRRAAVTRLAAQIDKNAAQAASLDADRADLEVSLVQARIDLERTVVHAPYDGRIESRSVQPGARVAPGTPLFEILDPERIEIPVSLPASRFGDVKAGATAEVRLPGGGDDDRWSATVARLAPGVRADDRTFLVYLESTGPDAVPPGAFVSARIAGRRYPGVFAIPRTAFVGDTVFVAENGVAAARRPSVVRALPATVLCTGGIESGDRIIVTNLEEVADGARIEAAGDA